jgi:hypothetical protein
MLHDTTVDRMLGGFLIGSVFGSLIFKRSPLVGAFAGGMIFSILGSRSYIPSKRRKKIF